MKIYVVQLDLSLIISRLSKFRLGEFNSEYPQVFIKAGKPDEACYLAYCKFTETILKQDSSVATAKLLKDVTHDIKVIKVYCKDEKKL